MKHLTVLALGLAAALATGGCSMSTGSFTSSAPVAAAAPEPAPVVYGAFLDGPVGQKLGQADKDKALSAEQDALSSGQRRTWKGDHGTFGYVEPAPVTASADADAAGSACRGFTSTIYIAGRPQVGHGRGCQGPDGAYRVAG